MLPVLVPRLMAPVPVDERCKLSSSHSNDQRLEAIDGTEETNRDDASVILVKGQGGILGDARSPAKSGALKCLIPAKVAGWRDVVDEMTPKQGFGCDLAMACAQAYRPQRCLDQSISRRSMIG